MKSSWYEDHLKKYQFHSIKIYSITQVLSSLTITLNTILKNALYNFTKYDVLTDRELELMATLAPTTNGSTALLFNICKKYGKHTEIWMK